MKKKKPLFWKKGVIYLFERQNFIEEGERAREWENKRERSIFHIFIDYSNTCYGQGWDRLTPIAWSSIRVFHVDRRGPHIRIILCCLLKALAKIGKWNIWGLSQYLYVTLVLTGGGLTHCGTTLAWANFFCKRGRTVNILGLSVVVSLS